MTRRPGLTMTELLVAIFVVAIGLAGVMSMVPFGAKQMSDALVADRATSHAHTIDGLMRTIWKQTVENNGNSEAFWAALETPGAPLTSLAPTDATPSYPVFIDPIGYARSGTGVNPKNWVGDNGNADTSIPRRTLSIYPDPSGPDHAINAWSQSDGFTWDEDQDGAVPKLQPSSTVTIREFRYNALAVIQRPNNSQRGNASLKVVVFSNRRPRFFPTGSEAALKNVMLVPTSTAISIPTTSIPATSDIRKGSWIMDATVSGNLRHANFYRVVSAVENTAGTLDIELHTPIKRIDGQTGQYPATLVLLAGVAAVFERDPLTSSPSP